MPTYELPLLLRLMSRPELKETLKRTAETIFSKGGIIRKIENLGTRDMPYRTSAHGSVHRKASYFLFVFDVPTSSLEDIDDECGRDVDVIRRRIYKVKEPTVLECTLQEEMQPPAYRKDVQEMIEIGKKKFKPGFQPNTGLDYYPFQR